MKGIVPPVEPGQPKHYQCRHCGHIFYRKIPLFSFFLRCPKCGSFRIGTAMCVKH